MYYKYNVYWKTQNKSKLFEFLELYYYSYLKNHRKPKIQFFFEKWKNHGFFHPCDKVISEMDERFNDKFSFLLHKHEFIIMASRNDRDQLKKMCIGLRSCIPKWYLRYRLISRDWGWGLPFFGTQAVCHNGARHQLTSCLMATMCFTPYCIACIMPISQNEQFRIPKIRTSLYSWKHLNINAMSFVGLASCVRSSAWTLMPNASAQCLSGCTKTCFDFV